jgi:hypothetical protein
MYISLDSICDGHVEIFLQFVKCCFDLFVVELEVSL